MSQLFPLICAMATGIVVGSLPGVRESLPWGKPAPVAQVVMVTPAPAPTPQPGAWMWNRKEGALDKRSYDQRSGPGAAVIYSATPRYR